MWRGREGTREKGKEGRKIQSKCSNINIWGNLGEEYKGILCTVLATFVLFLQLFCKFEIMSPPPTNFLIVRVLQRGQTILPSCDQSLGLGTYEHEDTRQ